MEEITSTGHALIESKHYALSKLILFLRYFFYSKNISIYF